VVVRPAGAAFVVCLLGLANTARAAGTTREAAECAASYVAAQQFRIEGKLLLSRRQLLVCSRDACAATLRVDCVRWLAEVDAATPTVVFAVRGPGGQDLTGVRVVMDGELLAERVGGAAVSVELGPHRFRFEASGFAPALAEMVAREGEKAREIRVDLVPASPGPTAAVQAPTGDARRQARSQLLAYVLGAASVASIGVGAAFEANGLAKRQDLFGCNPPGCTRADFDATKDTAERSFVAGDVLVGTGIVGLAVATAVFFARRAAGGAAPELGVAPLPGGAAGAFSVEF
jgi:hypothetical protein